MTARPAKLLFFSVSLLIAADSHAQAFSIDFGGRISAPQPVYGAAAGQVGHWNIGHFGDVVPLFTLDGSATSVTLGGSSSGGGGVVIPTNNPDEQELMGDFDRFSVNNGGYAIRGLAPGVYDIYLYSWSSSSDGINPSIGVSTLDEFGGFSFPAGQPWPGGQVLNVTYGIVRLTLAPGRTTIGITGSAGAEGTAPLNGIQIVPVPTPATALVAPLACLALSRRRRTI